MSEAILCRTQHGIDAERHIELEIETVLYYSLCEHTLDASTEHEHGLDECLEIWPKCACFGWIDDDDDDAVNGTLQWARRMAMELKKVRGVNDDNGDNDPDDDDDAVRKRIFQLINYNLHSFVCFMRWTQVHAWARTWASSAIDDYPHEAFLTLDNGIRELNAGAIILFAVMPKNVCSAHPFRLPYFRALDIIYHTRARRPAFIVARDGQQRSQNFCKIAGSTDTEDINGEICNGSVFYFNVACCWITLSYCISYARFCERDRDELVLKSLYSHQSIRF